MKSKNLSGVGLVLTLKSPHGVMIKVLDCGLKASKFEFQLCYYVHI